MGEGLDEVQALPGWNSGSRQYVFEISARIVWMKTVWMKTDGEIFIAPRFRRILLDSRVRRGRIRLQPAIIIPCAARQCFAGTSQVNWFRPETT
jgi:hypothetical protein